MIIFKFKISQIITSSLQAYCISYNIEKMQIIICLDDYCGMLFNNRRQSRDGKIFEDLLEKNREHFEGKIIMPVLSGVNTNELPEELVKYQALNCFQGALRSYKAWS